MRTETPKPDTPATEKRPVPQPVTPYAPHTGSPMDDEPEPGTDPLHQGP